ncbi:hypothetical protein CKA32_005101 [Geitlerinema sp. FC II]|nr:hypothetical protein CKA32_005101 [Geitlerinema sp. FC II]
MLGGQRLPFYTIVRSHRSSWRRSIFVCSNNFLANSPDRNAINPKNIQQKKYQKARRDRKE